MAFLLSAPLMLSVEGIKFNPSYLQSAGVNVKELCVNAALAGTCFHFYQQVSYSLLARVSPVTHSVTNSLKRVVVIVSSVLFFRTPLLPCLRHVTRKLMLCFMHVSITHHLIYLYLNCIVVPACRNWYCSCWSLIRAAFSLKLFDPI